MKPIVLYILLILTGLTVLAWPEESSLMMIKLSETHGPSAIDLVGLGIIFLGYIPLIIPVFKRFYVIQQSIGKRLSASIVFAILFFSATIVTGLLIDSEMLLWTSVAITTSLQAILIYFASWKVTVR